MVRRVVVVVAVVIFPLSLWAGTIRHDRDPGLYLELGASPHFQSVGQFTGTSAASRYTASGALIAPDWVLTAAHVVHGSTSLNFTVGGDTYQAAAWTSYPLWSGRYEIAYDIALVKLDRPVTDVRHATRYYGEYEDGRLATLVGFGQTGTGLTGSIALDGQKRAGQNVIDLIGGRHSTILYYDFDHPTDPRYNLIGSSEPLDLEFLIAPGDSGGGLFLSTPRGWRLAGVHSFGGAIDGLVDSSYGDYAGDIRVSVFNDWIDHIVTSSFRLETISGSTYFIDPRFRFFSTAVPEPSAVLSVTLMLSALLGRRRR